MAKTKTLSGPKPVKVYVVFLCERQTVLLALEMIGPIPGTVMTLRQLSSLLAKVSISSVTASIRSSSCRQSLARSATMRTMRGERRSVRLARMSGSAWRRKRSPCPDNDAALQKKAANLIDHCSSVAD